MTRNRDLDHPFGYEPPADDTASQQAPERGTPCNCIDGQNCRGYPNCRYSKTPEVDAIATGVIASIHAHPDYLRLYSKASDLERRLLAAEEERDKFHSLLDIVRADRQRWSDELAAAQAEKAEAMGRFAEAEDQWNKDAQEHVDSHNAVYLILHSLYGQPITIKELATKAVAEIAALKLDNERLKSQLASQHDHIADAVEWHQTAIERAQEIAALRQRLEQCEKDAARWREAHSNPGGVRHLLRLLSEEKGSHEDLDTMIDRIMLSRAAALAAEPPTKER